MVGEGNRLLHAALIALWAASSLAYGQQIAPDAANPIHPLQDENLLENLPPGYKIGFQVTKGSMDMTEMVPESETVDDWTELLTTQVFHGLNNATVESFQQWMQQSSQSSCPGGKFTPIARNSENGYPFMVALMACPLNRKTGKPEYTWVKAIRGKDSFYVVQKASRFEPSKEQVTQWVRYLRSVTVCDTRDETRACPALVPQGRMDNSGLRQFR